MRVVKPHFYHTILLCLLLVGSVFAQDATPTPTETAPPQRLKIWWPDILAADDNSQIYSVLVEQTNEFLETQENVTVEARLRRVGTTGGIMSTLRTGSLVAEGALPTVTLIRRQDLIVSELGGYIQSLEGLVPSSVQGDLDTALQLGQVNGDLYGIPYMLELQHVVYRPDDDIDYSSWSYDDLLSRRESFVFPAGREGGLSDVVMLQYREAGGTVARTGELLFNEQAVHTTLDFYEEASDIGIIDGFTLNFDTSDDYILQFMDGTYNAGVFTSTEYLNLREEESNLQLAPIPTPSGATASVMDGWMWVVITSDPQQQKLALDYIMWMVDPIQQAEVAESINRLPSRRSTFQEVVNRDIYEPYIDLLDNAVLPVTENGGGALARNIQEALSKVLTLEQTAEQAFEFVFDQQSQ